MNFKKIFLPYITFITVFAAQMILLGFLLRFLPVISPLTNQLFPGLLQAIGRERVHVVGVPERIGALKNFGRIGV